MYVCVYVSTYHYVLERGIPVSCSWIEPDHPLSSKYALLMVFVRAESTLDETIYICIYM